MAIKRKKWLEMLEQMEYQKNTKVVARDDKPVMNSSGLVVTPMDYKNALEQNKKKTTTKTSSKKTNTKTTSTNNERTWFKGSSAFDDGYDIGDVTKSILGTVADFSQDLKTGVGKLGEAVIDTGAYAVGGIADAIGQDEFADKTKKFIAKDLIQETGITDIAQDFDPLGVLNNIINGNLDTYGVDQAKKRFSNVSSVFNIDEDRQIYDTGTHHEANSVLGDKSDSLVQSGAQLLAQFGLQAVGVPWFVTSGVRSFGGGLEESFNNNATYGEAGAYGLISAGAEILTEKISGGISFGSKTLDAGVKKALGESISSKVVSTLARFGLDVAGEGFEEVASEVITNVGKKLTYEDDKTWGELLFSEEAMDAYLESAIGGMVLGGVGNTGRAVNSIRTGRDYDTDLTSNEQKVVDAEIESRVNEQQEKTGRELTKKEITKIEEQAMKDFKKGYVSTDTIENTLLAEDDAEITALQERLAQETDPKSKADIQSLINMNELNRQTNLDNLLKNNQYFQESYNEKAKKTQDFTYESSEKLSEQRKTIYESAKELGLNNTNRTHETIDFYAKIAEDRKTNYKLVNNAKLEELGYSVEGATIDGLVTSKNGEVLINIESPKALNKVVGHETTHLLEGTEEYKHLQDFAIEYAKTKGDYQARVDTLNEVYKGINADLKKELTSDIVGEYLFTDEQFVNDLSVQKPNVFQKVYNYIKHLYKMATAGSTEARQLEQLKYKFEKAYNKNVSNNNNADTKYSLTDNQVSITDEVNDIHSGETFNTMSAKINGEVVGTIEYSEYNGTPSVKMIEIKPEYRRRGIATKLLQELQKKYPDQEIDFGMSTEDGTKLIENVTYQVENKEYVKTQKQLEKVNNRINEIETNNVWNDNIDTEYYKLLDKQRKLDKKLFDLEVDGKNAKKTFVKLDNTNPTSNPDIRYSLSKDTADNKYDYQSSRPKVRGGWTIEKIQKQLKTETSTGSPTTELAKYNNIAEIIDNLYYHGSTSLHKNLKAGSTVGEAYRGGGYGEDYHSISLSKSKNIASNFTAMAHNGVVTPVLVRKGANVIEMPEIEDAIDLEDILPELWEQKVDAVKIGDWDIEKKGYGEQELVVLNPKAITVLDKGAEYYPVFHKPKFANLNETEVKELINKHLQHSIDGLTQRIEQIKNGELVSYAKLSEEERSQVINGYERRIVELKDKISNILSDEKMSLSPKNQDIAPTGSYNVYGKDLLKQQVEEAIAPLQEQIRDLTNQLARDTLSYTKPAETPNVEEIAPITQPVSTMQDEIDNLIKIRDTQSGSEYASAFYALEKKYGKAELYKALNRHYKGLPVEEEAPLNVMEKEPNIDSIAQNEIAPIAEDTTPDTMPDTTTVESPFDTRDIKEVGKRNVKAYQYENPEVRPFFQQEAQSMLGDLANSIKGHREYSDALYYATNGEEGWYGVDRQTTDDISYLLDNFNYTYAEIEKGLKAIIEDNGAENIAVAKRIEFMLDERLRKGYTNIDGVQIPANQDYINLLNEKQATKYNAKISSTLSDNDIPYVEAEPAPITPKIQKGNTDTINDTKAPENQNMGSRIIKKLEKSEGRVTKASEPEAVNEAKQLTIEGEEVDLVTKTKKQLRKALLGTEQQKQFIANALDNAKNRSMALMNNTDTIRNTELVFGREAGKVLNDAIFQKEIDNEADSIRWQNQERQELKELGIKARSKESEAVQKYGEKQYVNENGKVVPYGDAQLASEFDSETQDRIKRAVEVIRAKYDDYIERANNVLTKLGFEPIKKRKDYMRHFQELNDVFSRYGIPFNAQHMKEHMLPTDINGLTEFWSPQKNYFANMQPRKGINTTYDAITGIDGYISGIANLIFHTEDIQRGRAFEELIRETYGEDKGWDNLEKLPLDLRQERAEKIQDNHLSNYVAWLHEWTNNVAGKKNKIDRSIETMFGRTAFSTLDTIRKQVGANMIGFNVSSSLTNLIAPVQAIAKTNKLAVAKGTADTIKNIFVKDNFVNENKFLTSRMGTDMLSKNAWQKIQDAGFVFMKGVDWFASNQIVRSKYYELRSKGLSKEQAHAEAGKFASRIMGDRTKGATAQIYNSKLLGVVTQFQLEVNNQLYSMFYDTYQESKENAEGNALRTTAGMTFTLGQLAIFTHLFGQTFEAIAGYNPTFDILEIIKTAFGWGDDEDEEKTTSERLKESADMLVDALPYVNILTGGGRIPITNAIPNLVGVATGGTDDYGNELTLEDELKKLLFLVPPTGGNQVKKAYQGLSMFDEDLPVTGSYTDSGYLRFPVEDTLGNRVQAGLFGQYASENADKYFDADRSPLREKQIQEYADLELPIEDYWKYRDGLKELNTLEEKFEYVNDLDVTTEQKNIMINNIVDREEKVDMSNYDDFESYEEFDFAIKNEEKYNFLKKNNIPYSEYSKSDTSKEAYNWAYNNPEKYILSKAVSDNVVTYRQYTGDIYDLKADKDSSGKSITGSRKEKVIDYVNNLNIDYEQRLILFKNEYPADDTYNEEIINYLNERQDISYEDMVTILEELEFTVTEDGDIYWN